MYGGVSLDSQCLPLRQIYSVFFEGGDKFVRVDLLRAEAFFYCHRSSCPGGLSHRKAWRHDADGCHYRALCRSTASCNEEVVYIQRQKGAVGDVERLVGIAGDIVYLTFLMDIHAVGAAEATSSQF